MATLGEMIDVVAEARGWRGVGSLPPAFQFYVLNVRGMQTVSESQYVADFPDWAKAIEEDYTEIVTKKENDAKVLESARLAESEGVKFIASLTEDERAALKELLAEARKKKVVEPVAPSEDPKAEELVEKPVMAMCEKCGKQMPMIDPKLVEGKMMGKCAEGHDMTAEVEEPEETEEESKK